MVNETNKHNVDLRKLYKIFIILVIIMYLLNKYLNLFKNSGLYKSIFLIYIGSVFYVLAAFYHLSIKNWTIITAFAIAIPILVLEYSFSLRGNWYANEYLSATKILILTMIFYLVNLTILDSIILKNGVSFRDIVALLLVISAVYVSGIADRIRKSVSQ